MLIYFITVTEKSFSRIAEALFSQEVKVFRLRQP